MRNWITLVESASVGDQLLTEGRDAYLFHGTALAQALDIVAKNQIDASGQYEHNPTGVSLTRDYTLAREFGTYWERQFPVVFVLDQQKLVQSRHKLLPRRDSYPDGLIIPDGTTGKHIEVDDDGRTIDNTAVYRAREAEEMVLSDISPLSQFLVSINVAPEHLAEACSDKEYFDWMAEEGQTSLKRRAFVKAVQTLGTHPLLNRWVPRVQWTKGAEQVPGKPR